ILDHLRDQGYREATVRIELHASRSVPARVNLFIKIQLGPSYPIGPITVKGNTALDSEQIADRLRHRDYKYLWTRPLPYQRARLNEDLTALTERYRALGYAGARLAPTVTVDPVHKNVKLQIDVNERKRIDVALEGSRRYSADSLRDQVTFFSRG